MKGDSSNLNSPNFFESCRASNSSSRTTFGLRFENTAFRTRRERMTTTHQLHPNLAIGVSAPTLATASGSYLPHIQFLFNFCFDPFRHVSQQFRLLDFKKTPLQVFQALDGQRQPARLPYINSSNGVQRFRATTVIHQRPVHAIDRILYHKGLPVKTSTSIMG